MLSEDEVVRRILLKQADEATRTCAFYYAPAVQVEADPTLAEPARYQFDRPFHYGSCSNPALVGRNGYQACPGFEDCEVYAPEYGTPLQAATTDKETQVELLRYRIRAGHPRWAVLASGDLHIYSTETEALEQFDSVVTRTGRVRSRFHPKLHPFLTTVVGETDEAGN